MWVGGGGGRNATERSLKLAKLNSGFTAEAVVIYELLVVEEGGEHQRIIHTRMRAAVGIRVSLTSAAGASS